MGKDIERAEAIANAFQTIKKELARVIVGQDDIIEQLLIALFARGHCLLIGVPGLAKTLLIKTLGDILDLKFDPHEERFCSCGGQDTRRVSVCGFCRLEGRSSLDCRPTSCKRVRCLGVAPRVVFNRYRCHTYSLGQI